MNFFLKFVLRSMSGVLQKRDLQLIYNRCTFTPTFNLLTELGQPRF